MTTQTQPSHASLSTSRLLSELGMLAASIGDTSASNAMFKALAVLKPESDLPVVGRALAKMNAGQCDDAIALLDEAYQHGHSKSEAVKCFLAFALHCGGHQSDAVRIAEAVRKESTQEWALQLADALSTATPPAR